MPEATDVEEAAAVRAVARDVDHDRYLAALLAPASARPDLLAIAAFHGEIARIPATVGEPTIAAIRLQWWRDQLDDGQMRSAPVADAARRLVSGKPASLGDATTIIDAYEDLLQPAALSTSKAVDAFVDASQGAAFRLSASIVGSAPNDASTALIEAAARSYGRVQLLRALPLLLQKGHNPFAGDHGDDWLPVLAPVLADARENLANVRRLAPDALASVRQAVLPVALVEPYLQALEGLGSRIAYEQAMISPLSRVWRLWLAKRRQRF